MSTAVEMAPALCVWQENDQIRPGRPYNQQWHSGLVWPGALQQDGMQGSGKPGQRRDRSTHLSEEGDLRRVAAEAAKVLGVALHPLYATDRRVSQCMGDGSAFTGQRAELSHHTQQETMKSSSQATSQPRQAHTRQKEDRKAGKLTSRASSWSRVP